MRTDTAGNPIYETPAYCGTCGGPTNTAGQCAKQSCVRMSPVSDEVTPRPYVQKETERRMLERPDETGLHCFYSPQPADLGYHAKKPRYDGQDMMSSDCPVIGGPCYYDGSGLAAESLFAKLVAEGHEAVWKAMEKYYTDTFGAEVSVQGRSVTQEG